MSSSGVQPPSSILEEHVKLEDGPSVRASPHADGTFHQSQLVGRDVRRGFFSPPDAALAEAVNHDADTVEFTEAEEVGSAPCPIFLPIVCTAHLGRRGYDAESRAPQD